MADFNRSITDFVEFLRSKNLFKLVHGNLYIRAVFHEEVVVDLSEASNEGSNKRKSPDNDEEADSSAQKSFRPADEGAEGHVSDPKAQTDITEG